MRITAGDLVLERTDSFTVIGVAVVIGSLGSQRACLIRSAEGAQKKLYDSFELDCRLSYEIDALILRAGDS